MAVMIGVDPHKRSHTAVAVDRDEVELDRVEVRASATQVEELLAWAARFGARTWAVESADGLGYLLAQQLVAADEHVVDVPATLSARVRVLASGRSNKNDANDGVCDRGRGAARTAVADGCACRSCSGAALVGEAQQATRQCAHRGRVSAPCAAYRAGPGRYFQGNDAESGRAAARATHSRPIPSKPTRPSWPPIISRMLRRLDEQLRALHRRMAEAVESIGHVGDRAVRVRSRRRRDRRRLHP